AASIKTPPPRAYLIARRGRARVRRIRTSLRVSTTSLAARAGSASLGALRLSSSLIPAPRSHHHVATRQHLRVGGGTEHAPYNVQRVVRPRPSSRVRGTPIPRAPVQVRSRLEASTRHRAHHRQPTRQLPAERATGDALKRICTTSPTS